MDAIEVIEVEAMTMQTLLSKHQFNQIDILQIDTEGFDYEIIKMIDFNEIKPEIINFEIVHLSNDELDECMMMLFKNGYQLLRYGINMIAKRYTQSVVDRNFFG